MQHVTILDATRHNIRCNTLQY